MKVIKGSEAARDILKRSVVTMGVFDGIHLGHQKLMMLCRSRARHLKMKAVAYTFEPHPVRVLSPQACPSLLNTTEQKLELINRLGLDICVVEKFTKQFSHHSPESFFRRVMVDRLKAQELIVGYDFTFGAERRGTTSTLTTLGEQHGIKVHIVNAIFKEGYLVSSTVTRKQVEAGHVDVAEILLGRPYFIDGTVIAGDGMGQQLGFPTANMKTVNELLPAFGVYTTRAKLGKRSYNGVTNVGIRPTFHGKNVRIETHLLKFRRQVMGCQLRLEFLARLRPELKFETPEQLIAQIHRDIDQAKLFFQENK